MVLLSITTNMAQDGWDEWLPATNYAYNSAKHTSKGFTPIELIYGRLPRAPGDLLRPVQRKSVKGLSARHQALKQRVLKMQELAKEAIQRRQVHYYNSGVRRGFEMWGWPFVWVLKTPRGPRITKFRHHWRRSAVVLEATGFDNHSVQ